MHDMSITIHDESLHVPTRLHYFPSHIVSVCAGIGGVFMLVVCPV